MPWSSVWIATRLRNTVSRVKKHQQFIAYDYFMPTYEYECQKCSKTFEIFQSMRDNALVACPASHCQMEIWGQGKVKRLLGTGAGLIFKGSGFYITDYRSQGYQQAAKQEKGETSAKSAEKPVESKPSEKPKTSDK